MGIPDLYIGFLSLFFLLLLIGMGVSIALALGTVGFVGYILIKGLPAALGLIGTLPYHITAHWALVVVPLFMLLGNFMLYGGIGKEAYEGAHKIIGHVRGGLLMATTLAAAAFGFASGSSLASAATFTTIALPEMDKYGYQKGFALAGIASAGTLAALIPPSAMMVIYCIFTEVSIGKVLIAGIFPGFLTAALFMGTAYLQVRRRPALAPVSGVNMPWKVKVTAVKAILPLLPVAAVILGGIYLGLFTATEAGATGAFVALLVFIVRTRGKNLLSFTRDAMVGAARTTSMIFIIIVGAFVYSRFLSTTGVMAATSKFMAGLPVSPVVVVILILFILLVLGTFLEAVAILALTMPIFFPIIIDLKVDPVWFGILVVMLIEIGVLTPPLGTNVFVVQAAAKSIGYDITLEEIFGGLLPFFIAYIISVALVLAFPSIALWLPAKMMGQ